MNLRESFKGLIAKPLLRTSLSLSWTCCHWLLEFSGFRFFLCYFGCEFTVFLEMSSKAGVALTHHLSHDSDGLRAQLGDQLLAETVGDLDFKLVVGSGGLDPALQFLLKMGARSRGFKAKGLCRSTVAAGLCALKLVGATVVSGFCLGTISLC